MIAIHVIRWSVSWTTTEKLAINTTPKEIKQQADNINATCVLCYLHHASVCMYVKC